jgi:hypothetical protein
VVLRLAVVGLAVVAFATAAGAARRDAPAAFVGADYYATDCHGGPGIIRDKVDLSRERLQLFAMHAAGLNSVAEVINFSSDASLAFGGHGGSVPIQPDGTLGEPYRSRFIGYLKNVRDAGFADVTIRFYPYGPNSPFPLTQGTYIDDWDPSLYGADWRFIQDVHDLTKAYGPPQSHFDLMAEGAPMDSDQSPTHPRTDAFIERLYSDYVDKYGRGDVFFSAVGNDPSALANLVADLKATGRPLPQWWGLDIEYTGAGAAKDLAASDAILSADGVSGSLALEETAYEDGPVSAAVKAYNAIGTHLVVEVEEYPNWGDLNTCWSAPYTGDAYLAALGLPPLGPLLARLDAHGRATLTTSDGVPVKALLASRRYTVLVTDASRKAGFRLSAFGFRRQTSAAFRGTVTWTIDLEGFGWSYASVQGRKVRSVGFYALNPS